MTQTLARTLQDIAGGIFEAATATPVGIERIEAKLPMEFGLRLDEGQLTVAMRPPEATQARDLTSPLGSFSFMIEIVDGGSDG